VPDLEELLGDSRGIVALRNNLVRLLQRPGLGMLPPILLLGETGTGKGLLAKAIHRSGPRRAGPFVDVNCAAIPDNLLEAELFGFERGAFTDARQAKPGLFQAASGGTLFLDEIGLLPESAQAKVLKAIEDRVVRRIGRTRPEAVDVSIVAATNADLAGEVRARRFRADLFHRIAVVVLSVPPLRERETDILLLARHFLARTCDVYGLPPRRLGTDASAALRAWPWPGNVRELANVIERTVLLAEGTEISAAMLQLRELGALEPVSTSAKDIPRALAGTAEALGREQIADALHATAGNLSRAAARLGIPRNTLRYRMERLGLNESGKLPAPRPQRSAESLPASVSSAIAMPGEASSRRRLVAAVRVRLGGSWETGSITEWSRMLGIVFDRLRSFGGLIDELGIAGCVAFFGLDPVEDAPRLAAYAALAARHALGLSPGSIDESRPVCVALQVAAVTLFRVGDRWQLDPAIREGFLETLGDLVGGMATANVVVAASATPFLDRHFELAPVEDGNFTGRSCVWLTGTKRSTYELWGRATRFVGRADELAKLRRAVHEASAGRGGMVGLRGEPGCGKSRLLAELAQEFAGTEVRWVEASCPSYGTAVPFLAAMLLIRKCLGLDAGSPMELILEALDGRSAGTAPEDDFEPALVALLGSLPELHPFTMLPAPRRRSLMVKAAAHLLMTADGTDPLVIALEDVQWIDRESQDVLDAIQHGCGATRLLLVITYRPNYRQIRSRPGSFEISLPPLPAESAGQLLDDLLGTNVSLARVRGELLHKTGGNPFYLEESVRALADSGVIVGNRGSFRLSGASASLVVPENVRAVVAARMDQLTPKRRRVLQCAAAVGPSGPFGLLVLVCDLPPEMIREEVGALCNAAFLSPHSGGDEARWEFRHALTHEAAYASLLELERKLLHASVLRSMERFWAGSETEYADLLADQAVRAEAWDRAIDYLRVASAPAYARAGMEEAIGRLETALQLVDRLPASVETARRGIDIRLDLHHALMTAGRVRDVAELQPEAERLARQIDDGPRLAQVLRHRSHLSWQGGRYRIAAGYARQALDVLNVTPDGATQLQATYCLGISLHALGDYRGSERSFAWIVEGPGAQLVSGVSALIGRVSALTVPLDAPAWSWRGFSLGMTGDFASGLQAIGKGVDLAETRGYAQSRIMARTIEALTFTYAGRMAERVASMAEIVALCEQIGFVGWLPGAYSTYGFMLTRLGRVGDETLNYLEQAVIANEKMGLRVFHAQRYCWWAEGLLRAGNVADARRRADTAVDLAASMEERGVEAEALMVRALVAHAEGAAASGHEDLMRALAISQTLEARPFEAQCHLALGTILGAMGKADESADHHARGDALCREMGISPWWSNGGQS